MGGSKTNIFAPDLSSMRGPLSFGGYYEGMYPKRNVVQEAYRLITSKEFSPIGLRKKKKDLNLSDVVDLEPNSFNSVQAIDEKIEELKKLRRRIESRPMVDFGPGTSSSLLSAAVVAALVAIVLTFGLSFVSRRGRQRLNRAIRNRGVAVGMNSNEAESILGRWYRLRFKVSGKDAVSNCWFYPPPQEWPLSKGGPGCVVFLANDSVSEVLYLNE